MFVGSGPKDISEGPLPAPAAPALQLRLREVNRIRMLEDPALDDLRWETILTEEGIGRPDVVAEGIAVPRNPDGERSSRSVCEMASRMRRRRASICNPPSLRAS